MIEILLLDIDDTLLDFSWAVDQAIHRTYRELGAEMTDEMYARYHVVNQLWWQAYERGEIDRRKQCAIVWLASFVVGAYDGFYGPGTGTFLLLIYCNLAKMDVRTAGGNVKLVNLSSNIGAFVTSLRSGQVFLVLGLIGAVTSIAGHYVGSGLAIKNGSKIVRPTVVIVLILLAVKVVYELITK